MTNDSKHGADSIESLRERLKLLDKMGSTVEEMEDAMFQESLNTGGEATMYWTAYLSSEDPLQWIDNFLSDFPDEN